MSTTKKLLLMVAAVYVGGFLYDVSWTLLAEAWKIIEGLPFALLGTVFGVLFGYALARMNKQRNRLDELEQHTFDVLDRINRLLVKYPKRGR